MEFNPIKIKRMNSKICPICASENTQEQLNWGRYKINSCHNCRLIFTTPLPSDSELEAFYQGFLFQQPDILHFQRKIKNRKKELKRLFNFNENKNTFSGKKFLDFGAGTGIAYKAACDLGFETYYHDLDKQAMAFTSKHFGLTSEFIIDDIEECDIKFDFIFSDNVIEHVKTPVTFVEKLLNRLEDGGTLVIKTPHAGNTETYFNPMISIKGYFLSALKYNSFLNVIRSYIQRFWHCDPPRHLFSFSEESLKQLAIKLKRNSIHSEINYYRTPLFSNTITKQFFSKDKRLTLLESIIIRLIIWPVIPIEILLQSLKRILLAVGILSPGGIILKIKLPIKM